MQKGEKRSDSIGVPRLEKKRTVSGGLGGKRRAERGATHFVAARFGSGGKNGEEGDAPTSLEEVWEGTRGTPNRQPIEFTAREKLKDQCNKLKKKNQRDGKTPDTRLWSSLRETEKGGVNGGLGGRDTGRRGRVRDDFSSLIRECTHR